jgi:hypothetical protein
VAGQQVGGRQTLAGCQLRKQTITDGCEHTLLAGATCAGAQGLLKHSELILEVLTLTSDASGEAVRLVGHRRIAGFVLHDRQ